MLFGEMLEDNDDVNKGDESKNYKKRVYKIVATFCDSYYKNNGEPPDANAATEGCGLGDSDSEEVEKAIMKWIKEKAK